MRSDILERLWLANEEALYITKQDFMASLADWVIEPHYLGGVMVAAALSKGSDFHFASFGEKWALTRADIRRYLNPIMVQYGCVTTQTSKDDARQIRFNKQLGFVPTGEDEFCIHYKLEQPLPKQTRDASCQ